MRKYRIRRIQFSDVALGVWICINLLVGFLTVFSAYGGIFSPEERVVASIAAMLLPVFLVVSIVLVVINICCERRLLLVNLASWLIALPPILTFCPLNLPGTLPPEEKSRSFTLLTYNIMHFVDFRGPEYERDCNATMDYILKTDADFVNLQECEEIWAAGINGITQEQIDALNARYPYRLINFSHHLSFLSKYPCELVKTHIPSYPSTLIGCLRLDIDGDTIHFLNVHLESIHLTDGEKELYKEALGVPQSKSELKREFRDVKSKLLTKLSTAFRLRAEQAHFAREIIDSIGGPFIVAGDFNDIPDCYAVRTIRGADMTDAYAKAAFGPCITFHADRFYFRIDQILYRGDFDAVSVKKGSSKSSDHSPLVATFLRRNSDNE